VVRGKKLFIYCLFFPERDFLFSTNFFPISNQQSLKCWIDSWLEKGKKGKGEIEFLPFLFLGRAGRNRGNLTLRISTSNHW